MRILIAVMIALSLAFPATAQETKKKPAPPASAEPSTASPSNAAVPADSPLVAAAKKAKGGKIKSGTVITNANMNDIKGVGGSVTFANPSDPAARAYQPAADLPPAAGRSKEDWQKLMGDARRAVTSGETRIVELQGKVAKLANDFYAWDDPAYRDGVIKPAWDQAQAELEAARQSLESARQRITDLEEEARKGGALPGWLR